MSDQPIIEDDGLIQRFLRKVFGKSYRTTIPGLVSFVCGVVVAADHVVDNPTLHIAAGICAAAGLTTAGVVGFAAKASNVTGAGSTAVTVPGKAP